MSLSRAAARVYGKGTPSNLGPGESEPRKCDRPKSVDIGELKDGDHIMVKHTVRNKSKSYWSSFLLIENNLVWKQQGVLASEL